jgi:cytochrome P450
VVAKLHDGPRIIYSPVSHQDRAAAPVGAWVVTKAEDIRYVLQNPDIFTSAAPRSHAMGETWKLIPLELDPPEHGKFRTLLNPLFSPNRLKLLDDKIRDWAVELIGRLAGKSECDFIPAFAELYPVGIFLDLLELPRSDLPKFRDWANGIVHDRAQRGAAMGKLKSFLEGVIAQRRVHPGNDDLVTFVTRMEIDGRPITDEEAMGICFLLFIGGLDTVVSSLSFQFRYLAENPDQQDRLRADASLIPDAVEELFRAFPVVTTSRFATCDTELAGVVIRKGDMVTTSTLLSTRDPDEFPNPNEIDLARRPNRHNAFSFGPHRCLGSHLARREIIIAMEEWMRRVPTFRIQPGAEIHALGGGVIGLDTLPLYW